MVYINLSKVFAAKLTFRILKLKKHVKMKITDLASKKFILERQIIVMNHVKYEI